MRENRTSGSEGGEPGDRYSPTPICYHRFRSEEQPAWENDAASICGKCCSSVPTGWLTMYENAGKLITNAAAGDREIENTLRQVIERYGKEHQAGELVVGVQLNSTLNRINGLRDHQ